jgi:hypothetical protein
VGFIDVSIIFVDFFVDCERKKMKNYVLMNGGADSVFQRLKSSALESA